MSEFRGPLQERLIPAFAPSIDSDIEQLLELPPGESFSPRTVLLQQDERPKYVRIIRSGVVRLVYRGSAGEETVIGLRSKGCWLGASEVFIDVPAVSSAIAITRCLVSSIPAKDFMALISANSRALRRFIQWQSREVVVQYTHSVMKGAPADQRLCRLREESLHSRWKTIDPSTFLKKRELAGLLDITPEHLSRLIRKSSD